MPQRKDGSQDNSGRELAVMAIPAVILLIVLWVKARFMIVDPLFAIDQAEFHLVEGIAGVFSALHIDIIGNAMRRAMEQDLAFTHKVLADRAMANHVPGHDINVIQTGVGGYMRFITPVIVIALAIYTLTSGPKSSSTRRFVFKGYVYRKVHRYLGRYSTQDSSRAAMLKKLGFKVTTGYEKVDEGANFAAFQARKWRSTITSALFDPDRRDPRWVPQLTPVEFCMKIGIKSADDISLNQKLTEALSAQCGKRILTIRKFPVHARAILALGWLNRQRQTDRRDTLAGDLAELCEPHDTIEVYKSGKMPKVRALVDPVLDDEAVAYFDEFLERHHGWRTAMIAMVGACGPNRKYGGGQTGVFASATFLWLKGLDRTLWYCLNNIGRRSRFHIEGAGAIAQYQWEKVNQIDATPHVEGVIRGVLSDFAAEHISSFEEHMILLKLGQE